MRRVLLTVAVLSACAKAEAPKVDTTAAAPPAPPAPAALKASDIAGTWTGESRREGKDSVVGKWTSMSVSDSTGKVTFTGTKTTVMFSTRFDADSFISTSKSYTDPSLPKGAPKVTFVSVGRMKNGTMMGTAALHLASKPDSVLGVVVWTATKAP